MCSWIASIGDEKPTRLRACVAILALAAASSLAPHDAFAYEAKDTIFLVSGGRIRGTIMSDDDAGVTIQLTNGKIKVIAKERVRSLKYDDTSANQDADEEDYDPPPPRHRRSRYADPDQDDPRARPEPTHMRSPGAVAGGAVMVTLGFGGMVGCLVGVAVAATHGGDTGEEVGLGVGAAGAAFIGIAGAAIIAYGRTRVRGRPEPPPEAWMPRPTANGLQMAF